MNRMLHNQFLHLKFYCLQLKMGFNYPLIEGNKTSNGQIDYLTFYSLQDILGQNVHICTTHFLKYGNLHTNLPSKF